MKLHFYRCEICGKLIAVLDGTGIPTVCCGRAMQELVPNRTDGAAEKHVPVFSVTDNTVSVQVGSVPHPMEESHSIVWVALQSKQGFAFKQLHPGEAPEACFTLCSGDCAEAVYAYCNLHGLWCAEAKPAYED